MNTRNLIFILGDQLSRSLPNLMSADRKKDIVFMCEVAEETTYVPHHKQKLVFILSAMRHFAEELREDGWQVDYVRLDDAENSGSFTSELTRAVKRHKPQSVTLVHPGEKRVLGDIQRWRDTSETPLKIYHDNRFVTDLAFFQKWAEGRKTLRMEYFYREVRKATGLLMQGDDPAGGEWNYDQDNRKPASDDLFLPKRLRFEADAITRDVIDMVEDRFAGHFGTTEAFGYAVTASDAERALDHFIKEALPCFGDYQDAMLAGHQFLYHSLISPYINAGLLDPMKACRKAEDAWMAGKAPLNAVEGFIRQIIGWREYVRGMYWTSEDDYTRQNALNAHRPLPGYFWSADTKMACVKAVVEQTRDQAYAHHIQRLMVTGVFCLLAGIDPHEVHEWYLSVYVDAFEWVEAPNVIGMALYADGGKLGSKPYAASGAYINRMSDYCEGCQYSVSKKTGENACPYNSLYWDFLIRNRERLENNPRISRSYSTWDRMKDDRKADSLTTAKGYLAQIEDL